MRRLSIAAAAQLSLYPPEAAPPQAALWQALPEPDRAGALALLAGLIARGISQPVTPPGEDAAVGPRTSGRRPCERDDDVGGRR
jgi:hypothetical protein